MDTKEDTLRTQCFELLRRCRVGLSLEPRHILSTTYLFDGLQMIFQHDDGKTYSLLISEIKHKPREAK